MARIALKELESERSLAVEQLEALVGRDPACGFVIDGAKSKVVSGRHARIFFQDNAWWIQDMSRNGTILDDERLQSGQRHALKVGQLIGLGESGPRLRVTMLESRGISQTMIESSGSGFGGTPPQTTAPRARPMSSSTPNPLGAGEGPAAHRSDALRAGLKVAEPTEPAQLSGAWHLIVKLRATHSDQRFDARATVVKVGRSPECGIRIPPEQGASVSRVHAEIAVGDTGVIVRDAGSRNGTFLNGSRIESSQPLILGDKLMLGAGGPTLEVEELHIIKGEGPRQSVAAKMGGSSTPDAFPARRAGDSSGEPPTAPSAGPMHGSGGAVDARRLVAVRSPVGGVAQQGSAATGRSAGPARTVLFVLLGLLALAAAIWLGRLTAT